MDKELGLTEDELKVVRKEFYRGIDDGIYTGYNVNTNPYNIETFSVDYSHSDLTPWHRHYRELKNLLLKEGFLQPAVSLHTRAILRPSSRRATYLTLPDWRRAPRGKRFRFFTVNGKEISYKKGCEMDRPLIAEAKEYNLILTFKNEQEVDEALDMLKERCSRFVRDDQGIISRDRKGRKLKNKKAIYGSDEVPLIAAKKKPAGRKDMTQLVKYDIPFSVEGKGLIVSTLIRKKNTGTLREYLAKRNLQHRSFILYVIRTFSKDYPF